MIRVIIDANIWLSFLINPYELRPITEVVLACIGRADIELIMPQQTIAEIERKLSSKGYYVQRNVIATWNAFKPLLAAKMYLVDVQAAAYGLSRDPDDDFLLIAAAKYAIDALVTGDKDLLDIRSRLTTPVYTVKEFREKLIQSKPDSR